jgi:hypothetical protein
MTFGDNDGRDRRIVLLVGFALFAVYVAVSRGEVKSYDGTIMVHLATRLLTEHSLTIDPVTDSLGLQNPHVSYGFGATLLVLPFDALQRAIHVGGGSILTLANPAILAACGGVLFLIGRRLGWCRWVCVFTALAFGVGTTALWQSTEMFSEPGVTLGSLLIVLGVLVWRDTLTRGALLTGVGIAISILFRLDSVLLIAPLALVAFLVVSSHVALTPRTVVRLAIPIVMVLAFQLWYDWYRYSSLFETGFAQQARGRGFDTPILEGLDMLLRSPGRGFFWTSPILLLAVPGMVTLYRRARPLTIAIAVVVVIRFLYFAHWFTPGGGVAWGPRLLFPVTALLAIPAGDFLQRVTEWPAARPRRFAWSTVAGLALVSAIVSMLSIAVGYEQYWNEWMRVPTNLSAERSHAYFWSLAHNPIAGNIHFLRKGHTLAPIHFRDGVDAIGLLAVAAAVAATVAAFLNWRGDAKEQADGTAATLDASVAATQTVRGATVEIVRMTGD